MRRPRRTSGLVGVGWLVVGALVAAACSEATTEELLGRYDDEPAVARLPQPDFGPDDAGTPPLANDESRASITPGEVVRARTITCPFDTSTVGPVTCGEVLVPGRGTADVEIGLTYARFETAVALDERRPDPIVYLHGGPGGDIVESADLVAPVVVDPFIDHRDVIVYDQRGGGLSSALPPCSRAWEIEPEYYSDPTPHRELADRYVDVISRCGGSLGLNTDFDLSTYNSAVHADDLVDLLTALEIDNYNLYGSSYGSRLAQTVMRDHPEGVRTVIMSGVYPIEVNLIGSTPETFRLALETVFGACTADAECAGALPDPWAALAQSVERLDADPVRTQLPIGGSDSIDLVIGGDDLVNALHAALYRSDTAAMVPDLLIDLLDGDSSRLERLARDSVSDVSHVAPYLTVQCREEAPFTSIEAIDGAHTGIDAVDRIDLPPGLLGSELIEICAAWDVGPTDESEDEPATWERPTLLFSGGFDPITPAAWAAGLHARLPDSRLVHSNDLGHDSDESFCTRQIMADFVEEPDGEISLSCAARAAHPTIDGRAGRWVTETDVSLVRGEVDASPSGGPRDLEVTVPDWLVGWDGDTRMWWRDLDVLDLAVIIVEPGPITGDFLGPYVDVPEPEIVLESTSSRVDGWDRHTASTPGMDAVVYTRRSPFEVSLALVGYDEDLAALEKTALGPLVESVGSG